MHQTDCRVGRKIQGILPSYQLFLLKSVHCCRVVKKMLSGFLCPTSGAALCMSEKGLHCQWPVGSMWVSKPRVRRCKRICIYVNFFCQNHLPSCFKQSEVRQPTAVFINEVKMQPFVTSDCFEVAFLMIYSNRENWQEPTYEFIQPLLHHFTLTYLFALVKTILYILHSTIAIVRGYLVAILYNV